MPVTVGSRWGPGLKVVKFSKSGKRERPTRARASPVGEPDVAAPRAEYFHGARPAIAAIADESDGLVVPFAVQEVDPILERGGRPMIVLGRHEDEGVELLDLCSPGLSVRLAVLTHGCRDRLIEQGQIEIFYVHDFERCIAPLVCDVIDPARDGLRLSARPRASNDDGDFQHESGSFSRGSRTMSYRRRYSVYPHRPRREYAQKLSPRWDRLAAITTEAPQWHHRQRGRIPVGALDLGIALVSFR